MSFFDDASLVTIPSGIKDGKVYSVKPIDGSGDLTFSRGSDIEATRVNSQGYIEKATVNLLLQSNQFDTTWATTSATVTSGQAGYDGTNDAWLLEKFTATGRVVQTVSQSGVFTFSVYAKKGTLDGVRLLINGTTLDGDVYFDLASGTIGNNVSSIDAQIQSVGGGWYRCSVAQNDSAITDLRIYPSDVSSLSSSTGTIYIQDAQLNYGLVAQDYVETTTAAVVTGITNDMPRLSYDPANPTCPSLILEPSRTNAAIHSDWFGSYSATRLSVTANSATSPEGVVNATKLTPNTTNATHYFIQTNSVTSGQKTTISFFAKADGYNFIRAVFSSVNGAYPDYYQSFDLSDGSLDDSSGIDSADIQPMGNNWYRCTATATAAASVSSSNYFFVYQTSGTISFAGNDTSGVLIYGLQVETNASYPTSLIPTYGTSATRTGESASKTGISSLIGQTEGTIFIELGEMNTAAKDDVWIELSDGTTNNRILIYNDSSGNIRNQIKAAGTISSLIDSGVTLASNQKIAITYKTNEAKIFINGVQRGGTDTSVVVPAVGNLYLSNFTGTIAQSRNIKQALIFKTVLSDTELATLTA